jgi:hypothetical protein
MAAKETDGKPRRGFGGLIKVLLLIVLILLIFGLLAARTEGFRNYMEGELNDRTGEKLTLGKTHIGWPYDLVLNDIRSSGSNTSSHGLLSIKEARLGFGWDLSWRIEVSGCRVSLWQGSDGGWEPRVIAALGPLNSVEGVSELSADFTRRIYLRVHDSTVEWIEKDGRKVAYADGIDMLVTPIVVPNRKLCHYQLSVRDVLRRNGGRLRDVEREWIATETRPYVEIQYRADWGKSPDTNDLWTHPEVSMKKD